MSELENEKTKKVKSSVKQESSKVKKNPARRILNLNYECTKCEDFIDDDVESSTQWLSCFEWTHDNCIINSNTFDNYLCCNCK